MTHPIQNQSQKEKEFKSLFIQLNEKSNDDKISAISNQIISQIESTEIMESDKYKSYSDCFNTATPLTLIYSFSRLIGGICSTGVEYRRGFGILFNKLIAQYIDKLNFDNIYEHILKESLFKKTEQQTIKTSLLTGKIFLYKILIKYLSNLSNEVFQKILTNTFQSEYINNQSVEYEMISFFNELINILSNMDLINKKHQKVIEEQIEKWIEFKNDSQYLFHLSNLIIINQCQFITSKKPFKDFLLNFLKNKKKYNLFENESQVGIFNKSNNFSNLFFFLCNLLNNNRNHVIIHIFIDFLRITYKNNQNEIIAQTWNTLIYSNNVKEMIRISNKNYQYLLCKFSLAYLDIIDSDDKIFSIFNSDFFKGFLGFDGGKEKHNHINSIISVLNKRILNTNINNQSNYFKNLIHLFVEMKLSPITQKGFFCTLYNKLSDNQKEGFIESVFDINLKKNEEEFDEEFGSLQYENEKDVLYSQVNILKTLYIVSIKFLI